MKKKVVPILIVLAVVVIGGIAFWMGRQTAPQTADDLPAGSTTPELTPPVESTAPEMTSPADADTSSDKSKGYLTAEELLPYFEATYEHIWNDPNYYNVEYADLTEEANYLDNIITAAGYAYMSEYTIQYYDWKHSNYLTNAYQLNFSDLRRHTVFAETMYVYATPHTTLPPIGEFYRFDVIDNVQISDDGVWCKTEYQNTTIYYRYEDLTGGLSDAEIDALWDQHQAEQSFKEVNETVYAIDTVNIREECSASSNRLGQLKKGESITRIGIGQGEFNGWSKVKMSNGKIAYINSSYLSLTKPATNTNSGGSGSGGSGSGSSGSGGSNPPPSNNGGVPDWVYDSPGYDNTEGIPDDVSGGYVDPEAGSDVTWTTP